MHSIKLRVHGASDPVHVRVLINGKEIDMEVDKGAALSIISEKTRTTFFPREKLRPSDLVLKTYTNEPLKVVGTLNVRVQYTRTNSESLF